MNNKGCKNKNKGKEEEYCQISEKLKPCPFCGSRAVMYGQKRMVYCRNDNCILGLPRNPKENVAEAIKQWNERVVL